MRFLLVTALLAGSASAQTAAWQPMFDGKTLDGWRATAFNRHGDVRVADGAILLEFGAPMTGITRTGSVPKGSYEVRFEARRVKGGDFFASLTFPVGDSHCTWVTGGWGGDIVGLSSIDGWDASDNETRTYVEFEQGRWYNFLLRVTPERIQAWIDDRPVIDVAIAGRTISLRPGDTKLCAPFGFMSYNTTGALRKIEYREIPPRARAKD